MVGLDIDPSTLAIGRDMAARLALMVEPARAEAPAGVGDPPHPTWELGPSRRCGGRAGAETSPGGIASRTATSRSNLGSRLRSRARKRHTNSSTRSSRSSSSRPSACRLRRRTSESCAAMPFGSSVRIASSSPAPSHNRKAASKQSFSTIGAPGFEPGTSPTRTVRATRLRHAPMRPVFHRRPDSGPTPRFRAHAPRWLRGSRRGRNRSARIRSRSDRSCGVAECPLSPSAGRAILVGM